MENLEIFRMNGFQFQIDMEGMACCTCARFRLKWCITVGGLKHGCTKILFHQHLLCRESSSPHNLCPRTGLLVLPVSTSSYSQTAGLKCHLFSSRYQWTDLPAQWLTSEFVHITELESASKWRPWYLQGQVVRPSAVRRMFASRACRSSVMVGTPLSKPEMVKVHC